MAEAAQQQGKSESMEDILQSIKRIIEDDTGGETKPADNEASDILDLTQMVADDGSVAPLTPIVSKPSSAAAPERDVMESIDAIFKPDTAPAPSPAPAPEPAAFIAPPPPPKPVMPDETLVSDQAAAAATAALKPLVDSTHKDFSIPHIPSGQLRNGNTVEDLLLEALRPMLKAWLDEHLPLIVQKIVEKEVRRIVTFRAD